MCWGCKLLLCLGVAVSSQHDWDCSFLLQRARKAASMMQNPCEIVLVRHGETAWNREGRLQGQQEPGPPLDELGFQQAAVVSSTC